MSNNKIFKKWRGSRELYNSLKNDGLLDYWTHYSVKEYDNSWTEYHGSSQVTYQTGQILPVLDIVQTLPSTLNPGERYIVGQDATTSSEAEYYVVIIDSDSTTENKLSARVEPFRNNSGLSVRVINRDSMVYQLVNGRMITYDKIDGGYY